MAVEWFEHQGKVLNNVVATVVDGNVIGVRVKSRPVIMPEIPQADPPEIPRCRDRHIVRTENHVIIVDVSVRVKVLPRVITWGSIVREAQVSLDEVLVEEGIESISPEKYREGLYVIASRIARRLQLRGMTICGEVLDE